MTQNNNQPEKALTLKERMSAQQSQPSTPPSSYPPALPVQTSPQIERQILSRDQEPKEKPLVRASHFTDEAGIGWTRTGLTLPAAYWKGIVAYVNQAKMQWEPGLEKTTQQQVIIEAIGTWLNDHRSELPTNVNTECDRVRKTLRS